MSLDFMILLEQANGNYDTFEKLKIENPMLWNNIRESWLEKSSFDKMRILIGQKEEYQRLKAEIFNLSQKVFYYNDSRDEQIIHYENLINLTKQTKLSLFKILGIYLYNDEKSFFVGLFLKSSIEDIKYQINLLNVDICIYNIERLKNIMYNSGWYKWKKNESILKYKLRQSLNNSVLNINESQISILLNQTIQLAENVRNVFVYVINMVENLSFNDRGHQEEISERLKRLIKEEEVFDRVYIYLNEQNGNFIKRPIIYTEKGSSHDRLSEWENKAYPKSNLIESKDIINDEGHKIRVRLLKMKDNSFIRIEELLNEENYLVRRSIMSADHLLVTLPVSVNPSDFLKIFEKSESITLQSISPSVPLYLIHFKPINCDTFDYVLKTAKGFSSDERFTVDPDYIRSLC